MRHHLAARIAALVSGCSVISLVSPVALAEQPFLLPDSLVISSTTYDASQGAVAALTVGTVLPGSDTAATTAITGNNYVTVWNNESVDGSFGVTTPIRLTVLEPHSGHVLRSIEVPTHEVVTSFASKSELALNVSRDRDGLHLVFMGYASPGVGALGASNSDAVPGQDPTNPVTVAFGTDYAFHRTIVSVNEEGRFSYTPTINYGGDNGRAALLAPNGLYYTAGNANNGDASTFGPNGTTPDVTETSGLIAVNPIDAPTAHVPVPAGGSAEVDPLLQYPLGKNGALDKAGKDNNYRGVTEYHGALYFTKGSGTNGMDTLYTVSPLPTVENAASAQISVVPGFPTDSSRATGADFTPFAVFFANPTTLYVSDEGAGDTLDATQHAGLQKWSLVNGVWQLDYVLTNGLIGQVDTDLNGYDGQYPDVTTVGLRNLTGTVNGDGTVTLWAVTATNSASGDAGADPNKVVKIVDQLSATTVTDRVAAESFTTVAEPKYGTVYRGVAYVGNGPRAEGHSKRGGDQDGHGQH